MSTHKLCSVGNLGTYCTRPNRHPGPCADGNTRRDGRILDPSGRWYKDGFAPFQIDRVLDGTCAKCGGRLEIYPAGSVCLDGCSPLLLRAFFQRAMDKQRVSAGYMPTSEQFVERVTD